MKVSAELAQEGWEHPLRGHHAGLHRLCARVIAEANKDDRSQLISLWTSFERVVLAHIAAEEAELLPAYSKVDPAGVDAIIRDHEFFRSVLTELGVGRNLRLVKATAIETFVRQLRAHAIREDRGLYFWADRSLPGAVLQRFRRASQGVGPP